MKRWLVHKIVRSAVAAAWLCGTGMAAQAPASHARNDYARIAFAQPFSSAMRAFYIRDFKLARSDFERALREIPDNTLALAFLNASALQVPGGLDALITAEEDELDTHPHEYLTHLRLGFSYLFQSQTGRDRDADAREELSAAQGLAPDAPGAHVGLGIMRANERSINRAKVEFLAALRNDENNVLAREYLASLYQTDLHDPQRALAYIIDIPNIAPEYADIYYHIGSLFDDLGQPAAALKYASLGVQKDVGHVGEAGRHGFTLLARIYLSQKKTADARRVLHASITAGVDVDLAATLLRKIDNGDFDAHSIVPSKSR